MSKAIPASISSLPSVMSHNFSKVPDVGIERSKFDRSHGYKTTFDAGYAIPFFVDEVVPGDSHNLSMDIFARLATPIKPAMDNLFLDTMFFFVPMRLVWDHTENFFGDRKPNPSSSISYTIPTITLPASTGALIGSVFDYLGLPTGVASLPVNALPLRAYNKVYNDWLRDENLIDSATLITADSGDAATDYTLRRAGKRYDYFTSCLTSPQKGTAASVSLGGTAPVTLVPYTTSANAMYVRRADNDALATNTNLYTSGESAPNGGKITGVSQTAPYLNIDPNGRLSADLSSATPFTINSLRQAVQLQALLEKDARGGTRYIEHNWVHFQVKSSDARLQRSEYLGGGTSPINLHPVAQTAPATSPTLLNAQGNLAAFGTASAHGHGFSRSFEEHGYIIGICRVRADLSYQQGLHKMWSRSTRYDFLYPVFAHLGEQAVLSQEIYCDGSGSDANVFGYQERYAEYRYKPSGITGLFRSTASGTLDYWHLSQKFTSRPTLNQAFIEEDPPIDRIIAVPAEPHIMFDSYIRLTSARPLPIYSIPTLGGRF